MGKEESKEPIATATEKLDAVLHHLNEKKDELDCFHGYTLERTYSKPIEMTISRRDLMNILSKLHNDGYLNMKMQGAGGVSKDVEHYSINFNGEVLLQQGGYTQAFLDKELETEKKKQDLRISQRNEKTVKYASVTAATGAIGILIFEIYRFFC